jgi:hypothetical protein
VALWESAEVDKEHVLDKSHPLSIIFYKSIEYLIIVFRGLLMKTGNREHKERVYELFAQIGGALSNPHRLELLDLLVQAPRS